jgi:hypothetical protein
MKTKLLITLITLISILITGLVSYRLFRLEDYSASSLLTIASYLSIVLGVYMLSNKKQKPALH